MKGSRLLLPLIAVSILIHAALFLFVGLHDNESAAESDDIIQVSFKMIEKPAPEPEPEQAHQPANQLPPPPEPKQPPVAKPLPEPPAEPLKQPRPEITEMSPGTETKPAPAEPAAEISQAPLSDDEQSEQISPSEPAAEVNPFAGLLQRINAMKDSTYPLTAKKKGYQGTVIVELRLDSEGNMTSIRVAEGCRYRMLNNAAADLLENVMSEPYSHNTGSDVVLKLPVTYKLN
ncbi:MAG: TonB family protein [Spirochaetales bacterium]|uniref:TonB family protein n=1 Tax=Candidatus Thalassospirochaeta sargassi TaxID=3119039 RepID=A0AAJ1MKL4_9SPIO|nr:TonB family protein [Spirochaetales bacterium]